MVDYGFNELYCKFGMKSTSATTVQTSQHPCSPKGHPFCVDYVESMHQLNGNNRAPSQECIKPADALECSRWCG